MNTILISLTIAALLVLKFLFVLIFLLAAYAITLKLWAKFSLRYQQQERVNYLIIINSQAELDPTNTGEANINN
jgi:hypothetical protein